MIFESFTLQPKLDQLIESLFYFKDFVPDHSVERVVPTGHLHLIFELDGHQRHTYHPESLEPMRSFRNVWIAGMHRHHLTISAHQHSEMLVVRFKPDGALPFLHESIHVLNERVIPGEELLGKDILKLRELLVGTEDYQSKFHLVATYLQERLMPSLCPPDEFRDLVARMSQRPLTPLQDLIDDYPFSAQYLIRQFKKYVGLSPKYLLRIFRFNQMLNKINRQEKLIWTDVAYQNGFADQSHFIKEFRHFSGFNPKEFIAQGFGDEEVNFFPLDRN